MQFKFSLSSLVLFHVLMGFSQEQTATQEQNELTTDETRLVTLQRLPEFDLHTLECE